jgi:hypothetical protein
VLRELEREVARQRSIGLASLAASVKRRSGYAWEYAYAVVFRFLEECGMRITMETVNNESNERLPGSNASILRGRSASQFIAEILRNKRRIPFAKRVSDFHIATHS